MKISHTERAEWIEGIVSRHEGSLLRYAVRLTGNIERAREIVQETFFKLWKADRSTVENFSTAWLFKVCRNHIIDAARKDKNLDIADDLDQLADPKGGDMDSKIDFDGKLRSINDAFHTLPKRQQEVLVLKFQNGLSYKEISEVTGLTATNVGYIIHEGIQNLRQMLGR